jgi:hypothetical protein
MGNDGREKIPLEIATKFFPVLGKIRHGGEPDCEHEGKETFSFGSSITLILILVMVVIGGWVMGVVKRSGGKVSWGKLSILALHPSALGCDQSTAIM